MTQNRTDKKFRLHLVGNKTAFFYGCGISSELLEYQREIDGIHDDMMYAASLALFCRKRQPWYKRVWVKMKGWWQWLKRLCRMTKKSR